MGLFLSRGEAPSAGSSSKLQRPPPSSLAPGFAPGQNPLLSRRRLSQGGVDRRHFTPLQARLGETGKGKAAGGSSAEAVAGASTAAAVAEEG